MEQKIGEEKQDLKRGCKLSQGVSGLEKVCGEGGGWKLLKNHGRVSNKWCALISTALLSAQIEITASPMIRAVILNAAPINYIIE